MTARMLPLDAAQIPAVTTLLSEAFAADIGMRAICRGRTDAAYRHCLDAWFLATLRLHLATQQPAWVVIVGDVIAGAALLKQPGVRFAFHPWLGWVLTVGTHCGWGSIWRTAQHERQRAIHRPAQAHAVLEFIAVHGDHRGQGYARLLFDAAHQWSKTQTFSGIWLETTRLPNIPFFEHFGYMVTGRMLFEQGEALFLFRAHDQKGT